MNRADAFTFATLLLVAGGCGDSSDETTPGTGASAGTGAGAGGAAAAESSAASTGGSSAASTGAGGNGGAGGGPACTPAYGAYGPGVWPPACFHAYDPNAWINRPLPSNPKVDSASQSIVTTFLGDGPPEDKCAGCANDYDHPIYWAKAADAPYTLAGCGYSGALDGSELHALAGMLPGGGSDGHVVVIDQSTDTEWDFWQATIDDGAKTIGASACGKLSIFGDARVNGSSVNGPDGDGANAADTGLYSGQIRAVEIEAGAIEHAIAVDVKCTNGAFVFPATGSALTCGAASEPADGQFFQLNYSDDEIDALAVPAWKKTVLHAMHRYGFYADDTFGSDPHAFALHFESDKMYEAFGAEDPFVTYAKQHVGEDISDGGGGAYYYELAPGVDWSRIQVLDPCVIQGSC